MRHQSLTDSIVKELYPTAENIEKQQKGSCGDYIIDGAYCLEVKLDFIAQTTNNIFVEYGNERNGLMFDSGITLSAKWNYQVLYVVVESHNKYTAYQIPASKLLTLAQHIGVKTKTRPKINGNSSKFFGLGYRLDMSHIKSYRIK